MQWVLFFAWLLGLSLLTVRLPLFKSTGLRPAVLIALFLLYAFAGCLHVWIAWRFYPNHGDIWNFYNWSIPLTDSLISDPLSVGGYFDAKGLDSGLTSNQSVWTRWQYQSLVFVYGILNIFGLKSIYTSTIIFAFCGLVGKAYFFVVLRRRYPDSRLASLLVTFLIPSVVFWTAVIHKEAILSIALGLLIFSVEKLIRRGAKPGPLLIALVAVCLIFLVRKLLLVSLLPGLLLWMTIDLWPQKKKKILIGALISAIALFVIGLLLPPPSNIVGLLANRQQEFNLLEGGSRIALPILDGSAGSLIGLIPYAFLNGFLMPLPGTGGQLIYAVFGLETILWTLLSIAGLLSMRKSGWRNFDSFMIFALVFSVSACLLVGAIVPFAGAIIRYRSIFLPFLLFPFLACLLKGKLLGHWYVQVEKHLFFSTDDRNI